MFKNHKENITFSYYICFWWNNFKLLRLCAFEIILKHLYQGWNTGSAKNTFINHLYITYNDQYWMIFCSVSFRTVFFKLQAMPFKWVMKSIERGFLNKIKYYSTLHFLVSFIYKWICFNVCAALQCKRYFSLWVSVKTVLKNCFRLFEK